MSVELILFMSIAMERASFLGCAIQVSHSTWEKSFVVLMAANELIHSFFFSLFKSLRRKITLKGGHGGKAAGGAEPGDFGSVVVCLRRRSVQTLLVAGALAAFGIYSPLVYLVRHQDCHEELPWTSVMKAFSAQ